MKITPKFKEVKKGNSLIRSLHLLVILFPVPGLFGSSVYMISNRKKRRSVSEGISSNVAGVTLAKDFVKLVIIAIVIAITVWWLFMNFSCNIFLTEQI